VIEEIEARITKAVEEALALENTNYLPHVIVIYLVRVRESR